MLGIAGTRIPSIDVLVCCLVGEHQADVEARADHSSCGASFRCGSVALSHRRWNVDVWAPATEQWGSA